MSDTTVTKVDSSTSPQGRMGQTYLASGKHLSMRLWQEDPHPEMKPPTSRAYETVGYVIKGRASLQMEAGQVILLEPGDSWVVPQHASHTYKILETFMAVEATSPPAQMHGRDEESDEVASDSAPTAESGDAFTTSV